MVINVKKICAICAICVTYSFCVRLDRASPPRAKQAEICDICAICVTYLFQCAIRRRQPLVAFEDVARVDLVADIVEDRVVAVGDDGLASLLELLQVINNKTAEESGAIVQRGLVDDDLRALSFDPLHDALDGALAEVVAVALHRQPVHAYRRYR